MRQKCNASHYIFSNLLEKTCLDTFFLTSPDFSVAMAVDLLENWPSQINDRATGWLKYISNLKPEQVVLGYPAPDSKGISDGAPSAPASVIMRATQCLRTGIKGQYSCDTYVPPKAYPGFGGVFTWETSRDRDNNYAFAKNLKNCIINNSCGGTTPKVNLGITIKNIGTTNTIIKPGQTFAITLN